MYYQREQQFSSFDEFNSFPHGWDTDFSSVSPESYRAALKQSVAPGLLVNTACLGSPTLQRASAPAGARTFALPLRMPSPSCWRGLPIEARTLMVFPSDRELFSLMGSNSEILTIAIDQRVVDECLRGWETNPEEVFSAPRTMVLSDQQYTTLRKNLTIFTEFMLRYGDHSRFPQLSRGIQEYLLENMLQPLTETCTDASVSDAQAAKRVKAAADYILCHLAEPMTVAEVCAIIGCSRRSLEQCFRKCIGTSPKQFIQFMRFERCRAALLAADPGSTVSQVASRHGFWHMGQFSTIYGRMFGEKPSETLARGL